MALFRCSSGGGSGLISAGDIVVDGNGTSGGYGYPVTCGFKPKYIMILFQGATGSKSARANGAVRIIYDEDYSDAYSYLGIRSNGGTESVTQYELPKALGTATPYIASIDSNGFTLNSHTAAGYLGTWKYVAVG